MSELENVADFHGVKIERSLPQSKLDQLGVSSWSKWSGESGNFLWSFEAEKMTYIVEGKARVSVDGQEGSVHMDAGDLAVFPEGMKITFEVIEPLNKYYFRGD